MCDGPLILSVWASSCSVSFLRHRLHLSLSHSIFYLFKQSQILSFILFSLQLLFVVVVGQGKISVIVDHAAKHDGTGGRCVCTILVSL